jgi:hypothetical protein
MGIVVVGIVAVRIRVRDRRGAVLVVGVVATLRVVGQPVQAEGAQRH